MKEIAIASQIKNKDIIDYLYSEIKKREDLTNTIITNYSDNNFSYILFACNEDFIYELENNLRKIIIDYIENVYKVEFFKKTIKNPLKDTLAFNAYVSVLSQFDRETDENALSKMMLLNQTFFIDSFLEFRLNPLKTHWSMMAELTSDNISMLNTDTFQDVIRFLINTMENNLYKIKVVCDKSHFSVYQMKNRDSKLKKTADYKNSLDLIANVLKNCPNYIDVYVDTKETNDAVSFLSGIYANRLKIFSK